jgi:hypothetical protein
LVVLYWMGQRGLGKGYVAGALVRVDKLATNKFYAILIKLLPGDLDACVGVSVRHHL